MSEFLESIGGIFLFGLLIYILTSHHNNKGDRERRNRDLIKHSPNSYGLMREYNKSVEEGNPIMSHQRLQKELNRILNDPKELKYINESIKKSENFEKERKEQIRLKRKIGYKYDVEIFEIFDLNRELPLSELLQKIELKFNKNENQSIEIFNIWVENWLINKCAWDNNLYEVGNILNHDYYKLDENDITRDRWLEINNKILNPESLEFLKYLDDSPF